MKQVASPPFSRIALTFVALGVACLGLPSTSALAAPATTTTLLASIVTAGNAYVLHLLDSQPIPPQARHVTSLPTPLAPSGGLSDTSGLRQVHRLYLLPLSISVEQFVRAHLPIGEKVTETGSGNAPNTNPVFYLGLSRTCVSPHITSCGVYYTTTEAKDGEQELRVDAQVVYLPIIHATMPTGGVVTVTGYGKTSLANGSSDPHSVVLTRHQALTLATVVAGLKDFGGGMCMEDSLLLKISVVKDGTVVWSATADECPGVLAITSSKANLNLDDRSCSFWHVVDSFFVAGSADGTKSDSKVCVDSQNG
jgi:hypothetical protein